MAKEMKMVSFRLDPELIEQFDETCKKQGIQKVDALRGLIELYVSGEIEFEIERRVVFNVKKK